MENAPLNPDAGDSSKKTGGKKKKKNAEALGVFALDPNPADRPAERPENIWEKLTLTKRKDGETVEEKPLSQLFAEVEMQRPPETNDAGEVESPLENLSEPEERLVERAIVEDRRQAEPTLPAAEEGEASAAAAAVELFRHKIASDGEPAEQAFAETLHSFDAEIPEPSRPHATSEPSLGAEQATRQAASEYIPPIPIKEIDARDQDEKPRDAPGIGTPPPRVSQAAANYFPPAPANPAARPARTEKEFVPYYNNQDVVGAAFLGGLVGYLIGRRRGRIKTERKLEPIQKKLERRVAAVERDIDAKEAHIRKMARKQAREQQHSRQVEQLMRRDQQRLEAPEASQLHGKQVAPERIGHVIVAAGATPETSRQSFADAKIGPSTTKKIAKAERPSKAKTPELKPIDKRIETMGRAELLDLSGKVPVENTTLRQVYETHLVGEQGLRRLVSEYTRGGDVQKALRAELVEHEIDFERDPLLRDRKRPAEAPAEDRGQPTLETLLQKAGVVDHAEVREELATLKVRQARQEQRHQQQQKHRRALDVSMVAVIAVLTALVIMLLLRGR
jgi:hypothetical protein